jgi:hypothetical protein
LGWGIFNYHGWFGNANSLFMTPNPIKAEAHLQRIERLKARERRIQAALATEIQKAAKQEQRKAAKLEALLGCAVRKAAAASPEFQALVAKSIRTFITDSKAKNFLTERGWL